MSEKITCNGCNKCCALGAAPIKNNYVLDIEKQYYIPTINGEIITAYVENGEQKNINLCETVEKAIEAAQRVSCFCCYHTQNVK